jgi:hypothetical protein
MLFIFFTKKDDEAFFYGYWVFVFILTIFISRLLFKLFKKWKVSIVICSCFTPILFFVFAINTFPYYGNFPDKTIANIENEKKDMVVSAIANSSNKHPAPLFYYSDKSRIEKAFQTYYDTTRGRDNTYERAFKNWANAKKDTTKTKDYTYDHKLYELFLGIPSELLKKIYVDTILYDNNFNKLFSIVVYQSDLNKYSGQGFIGYRLQNKDSIIKLFPLEFALFQYDDDKKNLMMELRKYFF